MKTGQIYFLLIVLAVVFSSRMAAQMSGPQITKASMQSDGTVLINWMFDMDSNVGHYEIWRSTDVNGTFSQIGDVPKGTLYFVDKTDLFKTADKLFYYKVKAVGTGFSQTSGSMSVLYSSTSSTAKRTWGSIKAMFR
jgi:hypothetical protein